MNPILTELQQNYMMNPMLIILKMKISFGPYDFFQKLAKKYPRFFDETLDVSDYIYDAGMYLIMHANGFLQRLDGYDDCNPDQKEELRWLLKLHKICEEYCHIYCEEDLTMDKEVINLYKGLVKYLKIEDV